VLLLDRVGRGTWLLVLLPSRQLGSCWWSGHPTSSRPVGPWPRVASSSGWGSCVRSARLGCIRSKHRVGFSWPVGFGQRSLGRHFLARLASGLSSLGGFGSSSYCSGWRMCGLCRRPSGQGCCLGVVAHWWSCILGCWVGWVAGWLGWVVQTSSIAMKGVNSWYLCPV
jgi:hypothetical protein